MIRAVIIAFVKRWLSRWLPANWAGRLAKGIAVLLRSKAAALDTTPELPPNHPDRKVTPEDIYRGNQGG